MPAPPSLRASIRGRPLAVLALEVQQLSDLERNEDLAGCVDGDASFHGERGQRVNLAVDARLDVDSNQLVV
jgi:hypothetical protein